jgi:galactokinase
LEDIYQNIDNSIKEKHEIRYQRLKEKFQKIYGQQPKFFCRAPGRVNIIGEHIDYCGYSVLPAAIEQDFIMAYAAVGDGKEGSDEITISNIDKDLYPTETISTDPY